MAGTNLLGQECKYDKQQTNSNYEETQVLSARTHHPTQAKNQEKKKLLNMAD